VTDDREKLDTLADAPVPVLPVLGYATPRLPRRPRKSPFAGGFFLGFVSVPIFVSLFFLSEVREPNDLCCPWVSFLVLGGIATGIARLSMHLWSINIGRPTAPRRGFVPALTGAGCFLSVVLAFMVPWLVRSIGIPLAIVLLIPLIYIGIFPSWALRERGEEDERPTVKCDEVLAERLAHPVDDADLDE
jgi:hypothetical protein